MIQTMNNKQNTLSMALIYIDKHSLLLPKNTKTTMNAMFGSSSFYRLRGSRCRQRRHVLQPSYCRCCRDCIRAAGGAWNTAAAQCIATTAADTAVTKLPPSSGFLLPPTPPRASAKLLPYCVTGTESITLTNGPSVRYGTYNRDPIIHHNLVILC